MPDVLGGLLTQQPTIGAGTAADLTRRLPIPGIDYAVPQNTGDLRSYTQPRPWYEPSAADAISLAMAVTGGPKLSVTQGGPELVENLKSGLLGAYKSTKASSIVRATKEQGGYSVNLLTGDVPKEGIMVGKYANTDPRNMVTEGLLSQKDAHAHAIKNEKVLSSPENFFGTWQDPDTGKTYLDVSKQFKIPQAKKPISQATLLRQATKFGEKTGQLSVYDVATGASPPVGNYPGFVSGTNTPEGVVPYAQRLQEMGAGGRAYMAQFPQEQWWGTPNMERVYGAERMPQVKGLLAATSTNNQPPPNVNMMSEYVRRVIQGEPMIQPDFRIPETAIGGRSGNPGSAMGLEAGREFNLLAGARGETDPAAYHGPVVQEKVAALGGDPAAIVLDRIQTRLTEQPSHGIYATGTEGQSPEGANRKLVLGVITDQAKIAGENPDVFSGNVWAGIREHVKKTGELYGTPLEGTKRGTAGTESKSYDDLFMDRVRLKAKKLGLSLKEMESKLRSGDAELLSHILVPTFGVGAGLLATQGKE